jgi:hypothetical protein
MMEDRLPFVKFETRAIEDRQATIENGYYTVKDVDYAIVTPAGSKDRIEKVVSEWFIQLRENIEAGRCPKKWLAELQDAYKMFKSGEEIPEKGIPVKTWSAVSPAVQQTMIQMGVRTVEQAAEMNEEAMARLGPGARAVKELAINYLKAATQIGIPAQEMTALKMALEAEKARNKSVEEQMAALKAQLEILQKNLPQAITQTSAEEDSDQEFAEELRKL